MPNKILHYVIAIAVLALPFSVSAQPISDRQDTSHEDRRALMEGMSEDERRAKREEWRAGRDSMTDEQRAARHEERRARHEQRRAQWEALSEEERRAKREDRRSKRETARAEWEGMTADERRDRMNSMTPEERKAVHRRHRSGHRRDADEKPAQDNGQGAD